MKYQSDVDKKIFFEEFQDTPISYLRGLTLVSTLLWASDIYFFFKGWKINKKRKSYVGFYLKVSFRVAYRVMQEEEAYSSVWKYRSSKNAKYSRENGEYCKVHKLWKTPYLEEMNQSGIYSDFKADVDNKVFQIMIVTGDETIEIVMPPSMDWVKYRPRNIKNVITELVQKLENHV